MNVAPDIQRVCNAIARGLRRHGFGVVVDGAYLNFGSGRVHVALRADKPSRTRAPVVARVSVSERLFLQCTLAELGAVAAWLPGFIAGQSNGASPVPPFVLVGLLGDGADSPTARSTVAAREALAVHDRRREAAALRAKLRAAARAAALEAA